MTVEEFAREFLLSFASAGEVPATSWPFVVDRTARRIAEALRRHTSIAEVEEVGAGDFGMAGRVSGTREILKLTTDPSDVEAAVAVAGADLRHVAPVFVAGTLEGITVRNVRTARVSEVGVIVQRAVDSVGLAGFAQDRDLYEMVSGVKNRFDLDPHAIAYGSYPDAGTLRAASRTLAGVLEEAGTPFSQIARGLRELHDRGIYIVDVHPQNVGWDAERKVYRIFDLGTGYVANPHVHLLEGAA